MFLFFSARCRYTAVERAVFRARVRTRLGWTGITLRGRPLPSSMPCSPFLHYSLNVVTYSINSLIFVSLLWSLDGHQRDSTTNVC